MLADVPEVQECLLYIRCLGTKSTLRCEAQSGIEQIFQQLDRQFFRIDGAVNHRIDLALSVSAANSVLTLSKQPVVQFCNDVGGRPQLYPILHFVNTCNVQCKAQSATIQYVNFYTPILCNLRSGGELPTKDCVPVGHKVLLFSDRANRTTFSKILKSNSEILSKIALAMNRIRDADVPARLEVTTQKQFIPAAANRLHASVFSLEEQNSPLPNVLSCLPAGLVAQYINSTVTWGAVTMSTLSDLLSVRELSNAELRLLILTEDMMYESFLYGKCFSSASRIARQKGQTNGSDVAVFSTFHAESTRARQLECLSKRLKNMPFHLVTLYSEIESTELTGNDLATDLNRLTFLVVLCLNAELERYNYRRDFVSIDHEFKFLYSIKTEGRVKLTICDSMKVAVEAVYNLFFVQHEVSYLTFHVLSNFAYSR